MTPYLEAEAARLDESRLAAVEDRCDLVLQDGSPADLVDHVRRLVDEHPTRERLWGLLMTALYRSGRADEAIGVYAEARERLADELGIAPGEALQQLEAGILRNEPAGNLGGAAGTAPVHAAAPRPDPVAHLDHLRPRPPGGRGQRAARPPRRPAR